MKKISPFFKPAAFRTNRIPEPNMPAKPVPDPKNPTTLLGKPLQNPRVVDSPNALPTPKNIEEKRAIKKEALLVLNVQAKAIIIKADATMQELTRILLMCTILIKYLALHNLVTLLNIIRHL